jgi:hypothetical protein
MSDTQESKVDYMHSVIESKLLKCLALGLLAVFLSSSSCDRGNDNVIGSCPDNYPPELQQKIGDFIATAILENPDEFRVLDESRYPSAYKFVRDTFFNSIILTPQVKQRATYHWKLYILHNDDERSAFTLPGGCIFITTGMLKFLRGAHQLVGLLAHEVANADADKLLINKLVGRFDKCTMGDILLDKEVTKKDEIVEFVRTMEYDQAEVLHADSMAIAILCEFNYDQRAIHSILDTAKAMQSTLQVQWVIRKECGSELRKAYMDDLIASTPGCGSGDLKLEEMYNRLKSTYLP